MSTPKLLEMRDAWRGLALAVLGLVALGVLPPARVWAQDAYQVEKIEGPPQADAVAADLAAKFADQGYRVKSGAGRTVVEIWLAKQWAIDPQFQATEQRLYPFQPGELIGMLHLSRKGSEFRQQQVPSGWYTLRFGLQPVDGNHEGTSVTRDFLLMIAADRDQPDKKWDEREMFGASGESIGTTHPSMMSLQSPSANDVPLRHDADKEWWILRTQGTGMGGGKTVSMPLDIVVVGHAPE